MEDGSIGAGIAHHLRVAADLWVGTGLPLREFRDMAITAGAMAALSQTNGNQSQAAILWGSSRNSFQRYLRRTVLHTESIFAALNQMFPTRTRHAH